MSVLLLVISRDPATSGSVPCIEAPTSAQLKSLTDYLPGGLPLEGSMDAVAVAVEAEVISNAWQFAPMQPGETLQAHVRRQVELHGLTACPGPASEVR